jgi:translation elongation factor EF-G
MNRIAMFLVVAALMAVTHPLSAEPTPSAPRKAKTSTVEAMKNLKLQQSTGVISSVDLERQSLIVKNRRGEQAFSVASETQVKKGREKFKPTELKPGMKVTVRYWEQEGRKIARIIKLIDY